MGFKIKVPKPEVLSDAPHSQYSPSGSKRWISCPASISMVKKAPKEEKTNFYAEEGTAAHELGEISLSEKNDPSFYIGSTFNKFEVDQEMARQVKKYTDYVEGRVPWDGILLVESRFSMQHIEEGMFGTADATILTDEFVEIVDLKYGKGVVVEPEKNPQLQLYAIGALVHLARHGHKFHNDFPVFLTIAQPRAPHAEGPIRTWRTTVGELKAFQATVMRAVEESKEENPRFGPDEEVCRWCEAAPFCRARASHALKIAKLEFADFEKPKLDFDNELNAVTDLTKEEIAAILKHSKSIEQWLKSLVEFSTNELKAGRKMPGYKLVHGRSNRAWVDVEKTLDKLRRAGIEEERMFNIKPKSPAQMEKELTSDEHFLLADEIFKPAGTVVIAPDSDPRPSFNPADDAKDDWAEECF